jgi:uncharacterized protein YgfB (UPF0149 family)
MLDVLGDEYIAQHILQGYREYLEQISYKVYMSNMAKELVSMLAGTQLETSWSDILHDLDDSVSYEKPQTESESEIKNRILKKLNGKEGDVDGCI